MKSAFSVYVNQIHLMIIARSSLLSSLNGNVCDIRFLRRHPKPGKPSTRRMLCTNNLSLLGSVNGRTVLNFKQATSTPRYNTANENTIITWDVFMQSWRTVSCDTVDLIESWQANDSFWDTFAEKFAPLTTEQKIGFMNS